MENRKIYVLGSMNTDLSITANRLPLQGETINGYDFFQSLGGKGCNQVVSASSFGAMTYLIGCIGRDYFGQFTLNRLMERAVSSEYIKVIESESTGIAMIIKTDNDNRIILNQGANGHVSDAQIDQAFASASANDIFLSQFEVPVNLVASALKKAKAQGMFTVINPAPAVMLDDRMYEDIDCLILNQTETFELSGYAPKGIEDASSAAKILMEKGCKSIIITCGSEGSYYVAANGTTFKQPSYLVDVVDTTGAGDAFIGVFLASLCEQENIQTALQYASGAGAYACTKKGAQEEVPTKSILDEFMKGK